MPFKDFVIYPCSLADEARKTVELSTSVGNKAISCLTPPVQGKQARHGGDEGTERTGLTSSRSHLKLQNPTVTRAQKKLCHKVVVHY